MVKIFPPMPAVREKPTRKRSPYKISGCAARGNRDGRTYNVELVKYQPWKKCAFAGLTSSPILPRMAGIFWLHSIKNMQLNNRSLISSDVSSDISAHQRFARLIPDAQISCCKHWLQWFKRCIEKIFALVDLSRLQNMVFIHANERSKYLIWGMEHLVDAETTKGTHEFLSNSAAEHLPFYGEAELRSSWRQHSLLQASIRGYQSNLWAANDRLHLIPNGIDTTQLSGLRAWRSEVKIVFPVGFVGRIAPWLKDVKTFLRAIQIVHQEISELEVYSYHLNRRGWSLLSRLFLRLVEMLKSAGDCAFTGRADVKNSIIARSMFWFWRALSEGQPPG